MRDRYIKVPPTIFSVLTSYLSRIEMTNKKNAKFLVKPRLERSYNKELVKAFSSKSNHYLEELLATCSKRKRRLPDWALAKIPERLNDFPLLCGNNIWAELVAVGNMLVSEKPALRTYFPNEYIPSDQDWTKISWGLRCCQWLRHQRTRDAAAGRQALLGVWPTISSRAKATLIKELCVGLSIEDEPLLEIARTDNHKSVREAARTVLTGLPESGWVKEQLSRLQTWLTIVSDSSTQKRRFAFHPPAAWNENWIFDGLKRPKSKNRINDEFASWLEVTIGNIPMPALLKAYESEPSEWFALAVEKFLYSFSKGIEESLRRVPNFKIMASTGLVYGLHVNASLLLKCHENDLPSPSEWGEAWLNFDLQPLELLPQIEAFYPLPLSIHEKLFEYFCEYGGECNDTTYRGMIWSVAEAIHPSLLWSLSEYLEGTWWELLFDHRDLRELRHFCKFRIILNSLSKLPKKTPQPAGCSDKLLLAQ